MVSITFRSSVVDPSITGSVRIGMTLCTQDRILDQDSYLSIVYYIIRNHASISVTFHHVSLKALLLFVAERPEHGGWTMDGLDDLCLSSTESIAGLALVLKELYARKSP